MSPIQSFIAAANGHNSLWRLLLGILLIILIWPLCIALVMMAAIGLLGLISGDFAASYDWIISGQLEGNPVGTMILLALFTGLWAGVFAAGRWVHRRGFRGLFGPGGRFPGGAFIKGIGLGILFAALSGAAALLVAGEIRPALEAERAALLALPLIALIFIQVTGEELVFRGYLLQQMGALSGHWTVWAVLPSLVFGMLHLDPSLPGQSGFYYMVAAFVMGLLFCAVVWRSGTLWAAIGLHLAINIAGLTVIGTEGIMSGSQLWLIGRASTELTMKIDLAVAVFMLALVLSPLGRFLSPTGIRSDKGQQA